MERRRPQGRQAPARAAEGASRADRSRQRVLEAVRQHERHRDAAPSGHRCRLRVGVGAGATGAVAGDASRSSATPTATSSSSFSVTHGTTATTPRHAWVGQYCVYVSDLEQTIKFYETLGLTCTSQTDIPNIKEAILENANGKGGKIQLATEARRCRHRSTWVPRCGSSTSTPTTARRLHAGRSRRRLPRDDEARCASSVGRRRSRSCSTRTATRSRSCSVTRTERAARTSGRSGAVLHGDAPQARSRFARRTSGAV